MADTEKPKVEVNKSPKTINTTPTVKQIIAFNLLSDAIKNNKANALNMGDILKQAGYSDEVADSPKLVTDSKGFKQLIDKYMPEDAFAEKHAKLLEASTVANYSFPASNTDEEIKSIFKDLTGFKVIKILRSEKAARAYVAVPDNDAQISILKEVNKIKGNYAPDKLDLDSTKIDDALEKMKALLP